LPFTGEESQTLIIGGIAATVTGGVLIALAHEPIPEI
jgi:hypothetical protein